ncbi:hypothetical protein M413DRAFT_449627 [Hebeloma cylindrosporum]|uniref:Uncharacterized protein n=1 Tax=Hebeloma cylindrosporum TaxID=76867 RepID=A0A0C2Y3N3_HEBCY|nr:hypothetical protein M413DRAFT_449627 [Hebeloma cylindrosporum h7]
MATSSFPSPRGKKENRGLVHIGRLWNRFLSKLQSRRRVVLLDMHPDLVVDANGLPGDEPSDMPRVLPIISSIMDKTGVLWCLVGDILLSYYRVPKIMGDIEICVPFQDLAKVRETFNGKSDFCFPFRPGRSYYNRHLAQYPRFKINGMHQCFFLVPDSHYRVNSQAFNDIIHLPHVGFPLLPLPHYVRGLAEIAASDRNALSIRVQLEFLIDGMDIDEEWCDEYLDGSGQEYVKSKCTRNAKKLRMGSHPKYDGNLTTYIHDETEQKVARGVVGRTMIRDSLPA